MEISKSTKTKALSKAGRYADYFTTAANISHEFAIYEISTVFNKYFKLGQGCRIEVTSNQHDKHRIEFNNLGNDS